ncbi:thiopeptide-type bacteriocin biosynthesis protein [Streptomyces marincola]|uniref:Thiopeptide-type bacteriocin biosynthesis domain-containing protein n=1 Tax=Streptomyces marincola TaxID=2878388 RepID=A0A1W7D236_9ACTN|nr:thiopeptide-type bacteriocin biosynthesis protein [Streptomyces marincola]ARQ71148.1 hypothetical protein CAG99_22080 [Streptomyces marincola]
MTESADATPAPNAAGPWLSLHCFLRCAPEETDALLHEDLAPHLDGLVARGDASAWFFIRYDEGGPHLRVRVRDPAQDAAAALPGVLSRMAARWPAAADGGPRAADGTGRHGEVRAVPYEPETDRYGGPAGLPVAEEVFALSSRVAARAVASAPRGSARLAAAIDLAHATALACGMDRLAAARWLRGHAAGWRWVEGVPLLAPRHVHARVNQVYAAQREAFGGRAAALWESLGAGGGPDVLRDWHDGVRAADLALRAGPAAGARPRVWASQLHMLLNRLGVAPDEERAVCRLAARTLLDSAGEDAGGSYFPGGHASPDVRYLERSKFHIGREQDSAARPLPPPAAGGGGDRRVGDEPATDGERGAPAPALLPLPAGPLPDTPLREVLAGRVSVRGALTGPLTATTLGTLLWRAHASWHTSAPRLADGTRGLLRHRPYPSAGALYTAGIRLVALSVDGLAPGTYQCVPERRALRPVGPAPALDDVRSLSSYLSRAPEDPDAIVPDAVPAVLGLYVDLGRLRQRYGLRALRLGLLETGHLAQTLLLTATALGLVTTPLGGFRDDLAHELLGLDDLEQPLQYLLPVGRRPPDTSA